MHTQTRGVISRCTAGVGGDGRWRFSTDYSPIQSHSRWLPVCSNPSQSGVTMSSHFFHIRALICCWCLTLCKKQPVLFTWELVSCTQKQPAWELLIEIFCCPGALASTKHPHHHQLFTFSAVCPCIQVCACVRDCVRMSVGITARAHARVCVWPWYALIRFLESHILTTSLSGSASPGTWAYYCGFSQGRNLRLHLRTGYLHWTKLEMFNWQNLRTVCVLLAVLYVDH